MAKSSKEKVNEAPQPIRKPLKIERSLRVNYTEKELLELGKKLAEANRELENAENEKKSITGTLKSKCDSIAARVSQHSGELTNGYTYRNIPCEIRYDFPSKGAKTTFRLDNNEVIETDAMTLAEMQIDLPLSGHDGGSVLNGNGAIVKRSTSGDGVVVTPADGDGNVDDTNNP